MQNRLICSIEDDDDVKFPLAYILKMYVNTTEDEISVIDKTSLSTNNIIGKRESDISIKILWVLQ